MQANYTHRPHPGEPAPRGPPLSVSVAPPLSGEFICDLAPRGTCHGRLPWSLLAVLGGISVTVIAARVGKIELRPCAHHAADPVHRALTLINAVVRSSSHSSKGHPRDDSVRTGRIIGDERQKQPALDRRVFGSTTAGRARFNCDVGVLDRASVPTGSDSEPIAYQLSLNN